MFRHLIIYLFLIFSQLNYAKGKIFINIGEAELKRPVISVTTKTNSSSRCSKIKSIIKKDMNFANLFTILPQKLEPEKGSSILSWKASGVEYLIQIDCRNTVKLDIYHLPNLKPIVRTNVLKKRSYIATAHSVSDNIYKNLTGKEGIFQTKIAFIAETKSSGRKYKNLFISDYDGGRVKQLTYYKTICVSPAWSPKGDKIVYTRFAKTRIKGMSVTNPNLYMYDVKTGKQRLISRVTGQNSGATWSRDGKYIAFTINKGRDPDIYYYNTKTHKTKLLVGNKGLDVEPSFSGDGSQLVFSSSRTGNPELYVLDIKTKKQLRLTYIRHYNSSPSWSPTKDIIAFAGLDNPFRQGHSKFDIFLVKSDASKIERLTIASGNNEDPTWSPDGRHIIYTSTRFNGSDLFMIHFDGTGDKRITKRLKVFSPDWSPRLKGKYYY